MSDPTRLYWAAEPEIKDLATRASERMAMHLGLLERSGRASKAYSILSAYYGHGIDGSRTSAGLRDSGEDGEVTEMHINTVRPIVNNTLSLIAGVEPKVKARAKNADAKTLAQTRLAEALLEAYDNATASKEAELDVVRGGLCASTWTLGQAWMPRDGKEWAKDPTTGQPLYEGDIDIFVLPFWRIAYDFAAAEATKRKWCLFRRPQARWDLAAQLEQAGNRDGAEKLRKYGGTPTNEGGFAERLLASVGTAFSTFNGLDYLMGEQLPLEDVVWVWELRHLPSPALPVGRVVRYVEPDIVLYDTLKQGTGYYYDAKDLHAYEYNPERMVTGTGGHTGAFDLGGMQEFLDICTTSVANSINILGQMQLYTSDTEAPATRAISTGNTVLVGKGMKPEVMDWKAFKPEIIQAAEWVASQERQAMALNDVVMGQPDKGMPASAQALQRAQAMQFHAVAQGERVRLRARNANGKLKLLKRFAKSPRTMALAGKGRAYEVREWQSSDIEDVDLFDVEPVDPMSEGFEGRQAKLELLVKLGIAKDPDALLTYMSTGSLDAVTSVQRTQRELVEANVALLQQGIGPPPVDIQASLQSGGPVFLPPQEGKKAILILKSDPHHLAIPAYLGVLASPTSRQDASMVQAATEAIQISLQFWQSLSPDEAASYGIPPLPTQMMAMNAPPMPPAGPSGDEAPSLGKPPIEEPKLPAPPEDPLTGGQEDSGATGLNQ